MTSVEQLTQSDIEDSFAGGSAVKRGWTLFVACAGVALVIASMVALNTALADVAVATSATQSQLTWIVDSYTLLLACLLLPAGAIGDRYGRRSALLVGLAIFAVASFAPLIFDSPVQIIAARALAGVGAAFVMPATLSLLTVVYPAEARTKAVGIWAGVAGSGGVFGLLGTGLLLHVWAWQSIFWVLGGVGLLLFVLTLTIAESREGETPPLDWPGAATIGAAVAVFVFGILEAPTHGWTDPRVYGCLIGGSLLAIAFGIIEIRRHEPLLDVRLFLDPYFGTSAAAITLVFLGTFALFYLTTQFIQQVMGYSPLAAAIALAPLAIPLLTFSALSSWYLPKFGLRAVIFASMVLVAVGFLCMRTLSPDASYLDLFWPLMVISSGFGLATAPTTSAIMSAAPDGKQGVASAVNDSYPRGGRCIGHRHRGLDTGEQLRSPHRFGAGRIPTARPRPGVRLAGGGACGGTPAGAARTTARRRQQSRFRHGNRLVIPRDGCHRRHCGRRRSVLRAGPGRRAVCSSAKAQVLLDPNTIASVTRSNR